MRRLLVLLLIPLPLFAAGRDVSTVRFAPSDAHIDSPSIAFNGNHFLTLWSMAGIYGALSNPSSDATPAFPVLPLSNPRELHLTAAGSSGYLAIWTGERGPSFGFLTSEGQLAGSAHLDVPSLNEPRMAFNGSHILIVDLSFILPSGISVSLYGLDGTLVRRFPLPASVTDSYAVTEASGDFSVVTAGKSGINEWRVGNDGSILSTIEVEPPSGITDPSPTIAVAAKGALVAIVWLQRSTGRLSTVAIGADGALTRTELPNAGAPPLPQVAILPVGIGFVIVWSVLPSPPADTALFALRINDGGALLDAQPVDLGPGIFLAAASSASSIEIALSTKTSSLARLTATVNATGITPREATPTMVLPVYQPAAVVTGNGAGFTSAWIEQSEGFHGAVAGRVSHDGEPLDGSGILLGSQIKADQSVQSSPAVAHSASEALIVWNEVAGVFAARLTPFGALLDQPAVRITSQFPDRVSVAWSGSRYFIVWTDGKQLFGAFMGSDGIKTIPRAFGNQAGRSTLVSAPDVAWDGKQFIVVFSEAPVDGVFCGDCGPPIPHRVRVLRVSADGDAIDAAPVTIPGVHDGAHVASSGAQSLISLVGPSGISTLIVREEGGALLLDPEVNVFHWFDNRWFGNISSDVSWDGSTYDVAWQFQPREFGTGWLAASRVDQSGLPLGSLSTAVGPANSAQYRGPSVASNDAGEIALVISEMAPPSYISRARLYLMTELTPMPAAPPAPGNVVSLISGNTALIEWESVAGVDGYLIESSFDFGNTWFPAAILAPDIHAVTERETIGALFRVSAFGPGGLSQATVASIGNPRRRASH